MEEQNIQSEEQNENVRIMKNNNVNRLKDLSLRA